jgi:protein subunit release factor A
MESHIQKFEHELQEMNKKLELPEFASDSDFIMQYQKKQRELEHKMYEWELLSEELEDLRTII